MKQDELDGWQAARGRMESDKSEVVSLIVIMPQPSYTA
jgi:hypothetical protein